MLESLSNNIFTYKKLTEEEQQQRGILGRLAGVIADTKNPTRNGRQYSGSLWENVFNDPVMQEKIENRCCFGELGHPADREEVDPEKIAICLAETPKVGADGKLYGVFDILNTPCGKILKALCDYGTNIGVSSRGSGDIMENDEVDPETYYCECWDAVLVPAVKTARPKYVTESLETKNRKGSLKQALKESLDSASEKDKEVMKETLDSLDIDLTEEEVLPGGTPVDIDLIPEAAEEATLVEAADEEAAIEEVEDEEAVEDEVDAENEAEIEEIADEIEAETEEIEDEESEEDIEEEDEEQQVADMISALEDYDGELVVEYQPIVIGDEEYPVDSVEFTESEDGKLLININCSQEIGNDTEEVEDDAEDAEVDEEQVEEIDSAEDNGEDEVIESLKEMVREKDELEKECKNLKDEKAVRDAEVKKLEEELSKYKDAYKRTSVIAAKTKTLEQEVSQLNEQLTKKDAEVKRLNQAQTVKLNESTEKSVKRVNQLTESLNSIRKELDEANQKLTEQANVYKQKLNERTAIAKKYKEQYTTVLSDYISYRASMLGVRPAEITSQLKEGFTMSDINDACERILEKGAQTLPFGFNKSSKVKITEARDTKKNSQYGYEIDDDLLELAGLK